MAINNKRLSAVLVNDTDWNTVYSCATDISVFVRSIIICNHNDSTQTVNLAFTQTATPTTSEMMYSSYELHPTETKRLKLGIGMQAGDILKFMNASSDNISITSYGAEFDGIAETVKELNASAISAETNVDFYQVPVGTKTSVSTINVCNTASYITTYRVAHVDGNATALASEDYLAFDNVIDSYDSIQLNLDISMEENDSIVIYAATSNLSFIAWGSEVK